MGEPHVVSLRATRDTDLDTLFLIGHDPVAVRSTRPAPPGTDDRATVEARWRVLMADPAIDLRTVRADGEIVGSVARWYEQGAPEVVTWIDRAHRGHGIATRAMRIFLEVLDERPVRAHATSDDAGSVRVLEHLGFEPVGTEGSSAGPAGGTDVEELLYLLR
ncbi:GNAT family N-acetyltransferase [Agromyces sp. NPDC058110]|uniref:GNAT family N-acetyltransferase n=1 Tax=Agromyces sp. NPDC058110 TaxID=3346345 RepID=UPI0036DF9C12